MKWIARINYAEFDFEAARSRGPGGQNVNRTNSAVILRWCVGQSLSFTPEEKLILLQKLANKLTNEQELIIRSEESRDHEANRKTCLEKLNNILEQAFFVQKPRRKTKPKRSSVRKRLDSKNHRGEIKSLRKNLKFED